jgi:hypothetical protein
MKDRFSGCVQPRHLCFELEAQLNAFLLGEPVGHLRKNGAVEQNALGVPGHRLRRPRLSENLVEFLPHFVRVGPEYGRGRTIVEQVSLLVLE